MNKKTVYIFLITLSFVYISCKAEKDTGNQAQETGSNSGSSSSVGLSQQDSAAQFLIQAAAEDFLNAQSPLPLEFRDVRLKLLTGSGTIERYIICGQFLALNEHGKKEWIDFTTIKTEPYEQWLGSVAHAYCIAGKPVSGTSDDLSPLLKSHLQELQSSAK